MYSTLCSRLNSRAAGQLTTAAAIVATGVFASLQPPDDTTTFSDTRLSSDDDAGTGTKSRARAISIMQEGTLKSRTKKEDQYFTPDEVAQRNGVVQPHMWVSYRGQVYDVAKFVKEHPGGETALPSWSCRWSTRALLGLLGISYVF